MPLPPCRNLGSILGTRIQLCGRIVATLDGRRVDRELPSRQGRLLFAYLAANRLRAASRAELMDAVWPDGLPGAPESALSALVSKLRRVVGQARLEGRSELRLALADDTWIDAEAAGGALHRAEAAHARSDWPEVWVAARVAQHITVRPFVAGEDAAWIEDRRRQLEGTYPRALELAAHASLRIGGGELDTAERSAALSSSERLTARAATDTSWKFLQRETTAPTRSRSTTSYAHCSETSSGQRRRPPHKHSTARSSTDTTPADQRQWPPMSSSSGPNVACASVPECHMSDSTPCCPYFQIVSQVPVTGCVPNVRWSGPLRASNSPTHCVSVLQA